MSHNFDRPVYFHRLHRDNNDDTHNIIKLAEYVSRNGIQFEDKVKMKEENNPKFNFLFPEKNENGYRFYRWKLYTTSNNYSPEMVANIEAKYKETILSAPSGFIKLTSDDHSLLVSLLSQNSGSKESIRAIRKWILDRSHSLASIINSACSSYLKPLMNTSHMNFHTCLYVVYVVNDVLFNSSGCTTYGVYTQILNQNEYNRPIDVFRILFPYIPWLLQTGYRYAMNDMEKERIVKMVILWVSKGIIDSVLGEEIKKLIVSNSAGEVPPAINLVSVEDIVAPAALPPAGPPPPLPPAGLPMSLYPHVFPMTVNHLLQPPPPPPMLHTPQQQQLSMMMPPPPPPQQLPMLDMTKINVGVMADIIKSAVKAGHPKYKSVDISALSGMQPVHVEPGRLDIRLNEFYKKLNAIKS